MEDSLTVEILSTCSDDDIEASIARRCFYRFCCYLEPEFYNEDRPHLKILCDTLEAFYYDKLLDENGKPYSKLMIRLPPQNGKSRTLVNFTKWVLGKNKKERIITGSYGNDGAIDFSKYTRDGIMEVKNMQGQHVFSDVFPEIRISSTSGAQHKWALDGEHFNYLGVGVGGGVTGKGATLRIIDDLVKDIEVAINTTALDKLWRWLSGTFSSRNAAEGGDVKEIFCATLWSEEDPQKRMELLEPGEWYILHMEAYDEKTDTMLCPKIMSKESYLKTKRRMLKDPSTELAFWANYHGKIIDQRNKLFPKSKMKRFRMKDLNMDNLAGKMSFVDTADEGTDFYSAPIGYIFPNSEGYVDVYIGKVIFTRKPFATTQPLQIETINTEKIDYTYIETNKEGSLYVSNIKKACPGYKVTGLHSKGHKGTRILMNSGGILDMYFLEDDEQDDMYQLYFKNLTDYKKEGKNDNDDAPDSTSGLNKVIKLMFKHLLNKSNDTNKQTNKEG